MEQGRDNSRFGIAALDWITLTSPSIEPLRECVADYEPEKHATETTVRKRYRGVHYGVFLGERDVDGKVDFIVVATALSSNDVASRACSLTDSDYSSISCTRIDLQISVPDVRRHKPWWREQEDSLTDVPWCKKGKRPMVQLVSSEKRIVGLGETLYLGSRKTKNGKFVRMYQKCNNEGIVHTRFEVEFMKKNADRVLWLLRRGESIESILSWVMGEFPEDFKHRILRPLYGNIMNGLPTPVTAMTKLERLELKLTEEELIEMEQMKRLNWFRYQVIPSLLKQEGKPLVATYYELAKAFLAVGAKVGMNPSLDIIDDDHRKASIVRQMESIREVQQQALTQLEAESEADDSDGLDRMTLAPHYARMANNSIELQASFWEKDKYGIPIAPYSMGGALE